MKIIKSWLKNWVGKRRTTGSTAYLADFSASKALDRSNYSPPVVVTLKNESMTHYDRKLGGCNDWSRPKYRDPPLITAGRTVLEGQV